MTQDLIFCCYSMKGNKQAGYTYKYLIYWDKNTYREVWLKLNEFIRPVRDNFLIIEGLLEKVIENSGYKLKDVSYSTFCNWHLDHKKVVLDELHL